MIAAVNGYCLAGGMTLLLGTDIRVAAEHATFSLAEVKRGIIAGNGGTQRILEQLPLRDRHGAAADRRRDRRADGRALGPDQQGGAEGRADGRRARDYARQIAANAPLAVQAAKELAVRSREMDRATGLRFEQ